jgi:hypothetical protein
MYRMSKAMEAVTCPLLPRDRAQYQDVRNCNRVRHTHEHNATAKTLRRTTNDGSTHPVGGRRLAYAIDGKSPCVVSARGTASLPQAQLPTTSFRFVKAVTDGMKRTGKPFAMPVTSASAGLSVDGGMS